MRSDDLILRNVKQVWLGEVRLDLVRLGQVGQGVVWIFMRSCWFNSKGRRISGNVRLSAVWWFPVQFGLVLWGEVVFGKVWNFRKKILFGLVWCCRVGLGVVLYGLVRFSCVPKI